MAAGEIKDELTGEQMTLQTGYLTKYGGEALVGAGASSSEYRQLVAETRVKIEALGLGQLTKREYYALMVGTVMSTQAMLELLDMGAPPEQALDVVNMGVAGLQPEVQ